MYQPVLAACTAGSIPHTLGDRCHTWLSYDLSVAGLGPWGKVFIQVTVCDEMEAHNMQLSPAPNICNLNPPNLPQLWLNAPQGSCFPFDPTWRSFKIKSMMPDLDGPSET